jgi:hypothetical protein
MKKMVFSKQADGKWQVFVKALEYEGTLNDADSYFEARSRGLNVLGVKVDSLGYFTNEVVLEYFEGIL